MKSFDPILRRCLQSARPGGMAVALLGLALLPQAVRATPPTPALQYTFDHDLGNTFAADTGVAPQTNAYYYANQNTATTPSVISLTNNTPNGSGYALNLLGANNGTNNYIACGNPPKLNNVSNFTLTAWINLQGNPSSGDRILDKVGNAAATGFGWDLAGTNPAAVPLQLYCNGKNVTTTATINASNTWVFVAVSYDGTLSSNNVNFYSGGLASAVAQMGGVFSLNLGGITNTTYGFRVGSTQASSSDRTPPAWMDDVRVYTNVVLSAGDLETIRQQNAPPGVVVSVTPNQAQFLVGAGATIAAAIQGFGAQPPAYQWLLNSNAVAGATNATLVLSDLQLTNSGIYSVIVTSGSLAVTNSVSLAVIAPYNPGLFTNLWSLVPPQTDDLTSTVWLTTTVNGTFWLERSMAYDPATTNLLVVHRTGQPTVPFVEVLNALNGGSVGSLDESAIYNLGYNSTFSMDQIAVASDGTIYAGNLTLAASSVNYVLYSWANPQASQSVAYVGDPGAPNFPNLRWGDAMAVTGTGTNTQILLSSGSTTNVFALLTTSDGVNFTSQAFAVTNLTVPGLSYLAWAAGSNTFYAGTRPVGGTTVQTNQLFLCQWDPAAGAGGVLETYSTNAVPTSFAPFSLNTASNWLTALQATEPGYDLVDVYSVANPAVDPVLLGQQVVSYNTNNQVFGGLGNADFAQINGANYVFVLDTGNGIFAYQLGPLTAPVTLGTNATLASLSLSPAPALAPGFSPTTYNYAATNAYVQNPVALTASLADTNATMQLSFNGGPYQPLTNATASAALELALNPPVNTFAVQVVSQDRSQTNLYNLTVLLQPSLAPFQLSRKAQGNVLTLSWPSDHLGFRLLMQTNHLAAGVSTNPNDWVTVPGSAGVTTTNLPINPTTPDEFYQLVYP